ncbi:MAG TPA: tetratricopeptide repeat protein [Xanthobacteraceae bacterium]|nr:tetratricopeptide repeat protein [Xanthobacteraceae bacterium]
MNRDQRRGSGPPGTESPFAAAPNAVPAGTIADQFGAAVAHHQRGALAEAERRYRHILTQAPAHADSLHNLGLIALDGGHAEPAVELIQKAIAADGGKAEYHYNIALAWRALNRPDQVAAHLERAIEIRGDYALAHLNLGNVRREQGRLSEAVACYERALALNPNSPAARFNLANMLSEQQRWDAAAANYRHVLTLEPNHVDAHARLGAALLAQGHPREAIPEIERALSLQPELGGAHEELAKAYISAGDVQSAVLAAARALELNETADGKALFAQCAIFANFTADTDGRFRKLVHRALVEAWAAPRELSGVCISLIRLDSRVSEMIARADKAWPARLPAEEIFDTTAMSALADDDLLHSLLERDAVTNIGLERLITNVRHALLGALASNVTKHGRPDDPMLGFYCAIARQCFVNQYVFALTQDENKQALRLRSSIEDALSNNIETSPLQLAGLGAYFPLHTLTSAERLLEKSWPRPIEDLIVQQIKEPAEERRIIATLPALTGIEGEVSRVVREQYEENPYPRWIKAGPPAQPAILNRRPEPVVDVLIAGCGTGIFTIEFASKARNARFLAIDLSLASLGYAKRMAQSFGLTNVEFAQADIMKLGSLGRTFDFIDSSGVLHHTADPWAAWRVLLSLLRPDGMMQIGLYSELGRRNVVAARALIAERGYRPVPDDIRAIREIVATAEDGSLLKPISQWTDFFTISECRDLLFHPQEHRTSLPEIESFLAANGLRFAGFILDALTSDRFVKRFPEVAGLTNKKRFDAFADLDRWHTFETEAPQTFAGMYRFWVHKPGAHSS